MSAQVSSQPAPDRVSRGHLLTTAGLGQLSQTKQGIIAGDRLEGDVGVPLVPAALTELAAAERVVEPI